MGEVEFEKTVSEGVDLSGNIYGLLCTVKVQDQRTMRTDHPKWHRYRPVFTLDDSTPIECVGLGEFNLQVKSGKVIINTDDHAFKQLTADYLNYQAG